MICGNCGQPITKGQKYYRGPRTGRPHHSSCIEAFSKASKIDVPRERFPAKNPANINPSEVNKLLQENEYLQKRLSQAQALISDLKFTLMSTTPFEPLQDKACQKAERWLNQREDLLEEKK